jgi:hypothetical protein
MELTKVQNDLLTLLKLSEVSIEAITGIMVGLKNSEKLMIEMILYIADNHSNEAQINEKFVEMAMRPQDKMIYDAETGRYFTNDFGMKNYKGAMEHLKKQKPVSREEAIAQIQRIRQASSRTKNSQNDEGRVFNNGKVSQ